jgi:hypothetical protein
MMKRTKLGVPVLLFVAAFAAGCGSFPNPGGGSNALENANSLIPAAAPLTFTQCPSAYDHPAAPIVCIDDSGTQLAAYPDEIFVYDEDPAETGSSNTILFFTKSRTGKLDLTMMSNDCTSKVWCGVVDGMCRVKVKKISNGQPAPEPCKYEVRILNSQFEPLDPTIRVGDCCP